MRPTLLATAPGAVEQHAAGVSRNSPARALDGKQLFDLRAQAAVGPTGLRYIRLPLGAVARERFLQDALHSRPVSRASSSALSSLYSHSFAVAQSRFTVAGEMSSASAVCSTDSPVKNLSSTTRACCGSTAASRSSASSSATMSTSGSGAAACSSGEVSETPAPRLAASALASVVHQDSSHQRRGHGEEMSAVAPPQRVEARQAHVRLVDEGRRLQRVTGALAAHVVMGEAAQLLVDDRHELGGVAVEGPVRSIHVRSAHEPESIATAPYGVGAKIALEISVTNVSKGKVDSLLAGRHSAGWHRREAAIDSVTVNETRTYEKAAGYTYAEITIDGSVRRNDGSVGAYSVPAVMIYPRHGCGNDVGVVDWLNSAAFHFFPETGEFGTIDFTLASTGTHLFEEGYTYLSIQWNKFVTEKFGPTEPKDGFDHNHLVYGTIERGGDAWEILLDAARLLKNPSRFPGKNRPARVDTVLSSGYSQGGALQLEMLVEGLDPKRAYDGHFIQMIGLNCWKRDDSLPHYGFLGD